jgi:hypothetical protein
MKQKILKMIDQLNSFTEKLALLNKLYLNAKSKKDEDMILDMIKQLKFWGE